MPTSFRLRLGCEWMGLGLSRLPFINQEAQVK